MSTGLLRIRGWKVDRVVKLGPHWSEIVVEHSRSLSRYRRWFSEFKVLLKNVHGRYNSTTDIERTVCIISTLLPYNTSPVSDLTKAYRVLMEKTQPPEDFTGNLDHWREAACAPLTDRFRCSCWIPFVSEKGYIGVQTMATRPGDIICLLPEGPLGPSYRQSMPFILREAKNGRYELVGSAFVLDMMYGELTPSNKSQMEYIDLC
jgi:hypothetical protein